MRNKVIKDYIIKDSSDPGVKDVKEESEKGSKENNEEAIVSVQGKMMRG